MNPRQLHSEHYLKALIVVLSMYVGSFVYLELTTVKKEELLSDEGLYEVALEEITPEEKEATPEKVRVTDVNKDNSGDVGEQTTTSQKRRRR